MILLPALIGLYLVYATGYYKIVKTAVPELAEDYRLTVLIMSLLWPVGMSFTIIKAAIFR